MTFSSDLQNELSALAWWLKLGHPFFRSNTAEEFLSWVNNGEHVCERFHVKPRDLLVLNCEVFLFGFVEHPADFLGHFRSELSIGLCSWSSCGVSTA